ncbi:hypothetical protein HYX13_00185 [Candidatus Woesearchaeota archaeon]|nr:hypothetical protein [Candidatus Woesearchaeota archaeon]
MTTTRKRQFLQRNKSSGDQHSGIIILLLFFLVLMSAFNIVLYLELFSFSNSASQPISPSGAAVSTAKNTGEASILILPRPESAQENKEEEKKTTNP